MKVLGIVAGAALLFSAHSAHAVTIVNGSFEQVDLGGASYVTLGAGSSGLPGWTIGGDSVDHIGSYWQASDGNQSLDMSGSGAGSISQTLTGLTIGQQYTISFDLAGNPAGGDALKSLEVTIGGKPSDVVFNTTGQSLSDMGWTTQFVIFVAQATTDTLTFTSLDHNAFGPALDNVAIATTPIPGAILLFGSALGGMGFLGYRRRKLTGNAAA